MSGPETNDETHATSDSPLETGGLNGVPARAARSLSSITGGYVVSGVWSRVLATVAIPIIVANVSPADYGVYGVVQALVPAAAIVLGLGLGDALPIYYYEPGDQEARRRKLATILVSTFLIAAALVAAVPAILLLRDDSNSIIVSETLILIAATLLIRAYEPLKRSEEKPTTVVISRIAAGAIFFIGASFAVTALDMGAEGILGAFLIGEAARALILVSGRSSVTSGLGTLSSIKGLPRLLPFSVPLIVHSGSVFLLGYADRWLIAGILSLSAAGVYTLAYQIASVLLMINSSYNEAVSPRLYAAFQEGGKAALRQWHKKTAPAYFLLSALSAALLAAAGSVYLLLLAPPAYDGALPSLLIILSGLVFQAMYTPHVNALLAVKRSREVATRSLQYTALNLLLNVLLIPIIGVTGAALATLVAYAARYYSFARITKSELGLGLTLGDFREAIRGFASTARARLRSPRGG